MHWLKTMFVAALAAVSLATPVRADGGANSESPRVSVTQKARDLAFAHTGEMTFSVVGSADSVEVYGGFFYALSEIELEGGETVEVGGVLYDGKMVKSGVMMAVGQGSTGLKTSHPDALGEDNLDLFLFETGEVVAVDPEQVQPGGTMTIGCEVTDCPAGTKACCKYNLTPGGVPTCLCVSNYAQANCSAGGGPDCKVNQPYFPPLPPTKPTIIPINPSIPRPPSVTPSNPDAV